jgi:hypothetical protein
VTVYAPTSMGRFSDFPWDPSVRKVVSNANVTILSYHNNVAEDFPGTPAEDFALIATSNIAVKAGEHVFCTTSQDGSWLYVDGRLLVINYDYRNWWWYDYPVTVCQKIQLDEGIHSITVNYFKHTTSWATLEVSMDGSLITALNGKALLLGWRSVVAQALIHEVEPREQGHY